MINYLHFGTGSGFSVHITLKESNLAPLYQAVDHSDSNDNVGFYGDITITQQYCPFPVPEKYQLSLILHQVSITVKVKDRMDRFLKLSLISIIEDDGTNSVHLNGPS